MALEEHGTDECAAEARDAGDAAQFRERVVHVLQRQHCGGIESARVGTAEIRDPVIVGACQRIRGVRIRDQVKSLGKPGRVQERLIDAHRIHVRKPGSCVPCTLVHRVTHARIKFPDRVPAHTRPPDGVAWQVGVHRVAHDFAIDLEIRIRLAVVSPQRLLAEDTELGIKILLPELGRLNDMGVTVEHGDVPGDRCHGSRPIC